MELRTKPLGNCTKIVSKRTNTSIFSTVNGLFDACFFYKLNLSRDESSPKQQICRCSRRFNVLVHEVYLKLTQLVKIAKLSKFCLLDVNSGKVAFENCIYLFSKMQICLQKRLMDNQPFPVDPSTYFKP